jgi:hypothetical protein
MGTCQDKTSSGQTYPETISLALTNDNGGIISQALQGGAMAVLGFLAGGVYGAFKMVRAPLPAAGKASLLQASSGGSREGEGRSGVSLGTATLIAEYVPGSGFERTLAARSGEFVTVLRDDGVACEWVRVRNGESREGWIPREFLKMLQ